MLKKLDEALQNNGFDSIVTIGILNLTFYTEFWTFLLTSGASQGFLTQQFK